jgi:putative transposase
LRLLLDRAEAGPSVRRQCELLELPRSTAYYRSAAEGVENLAIMRLIDAHFMETPYYGRRRWTWWLRQCHGYVINPKRVGRLLGTMGIEAVFPGRRTTKPEPGHKKYPYLLRDVEITRPNQVWSTDITYVPLRRGYMYLVAVMDWHSRFVLSWRLSNTLGGEFCVASLEEALARWGCPEIFNSDQGSQFTSPTFTGRLEERGIRVSMDGRGRALDNVFIERLWRSVKYEDIYLKDYDGADELYRGLELWFGNYGHRRPHQGLGYQTPWSVYSGVGDAEAARRLPERR